MPVNKGFVRGVIGYTLVISYFVCLYIWTKVTFYSAPQSI